MSVRQGSNIIAGVGTNSISNAHTLLDFKWSDHKIYDVSWLRADTFSWQNGEVYKGAYQHLVADLSDATEVSETLYCWNWADRDVVYTKSLNPVAGDKVFNETGEIDTRTITSVGDGYIRINTHAYNKEDSSYDITITSSKKIDVINGISIEYVTATDGHKIVLPTQETAVEQIYQATGVAWYYIVDTTNQRFKLPRTKYGFTGLRNSVGGYVPESLPNIRGNDGYKMDGNVQLSGSFYLDNTIKYRLTNAGGGSTSTGTGFDASLSSSTYQDNAPVQQRATQMYLYFYVGEYSRSAVEQTAGLNAELFNNKADRDATNLSTAGKFLISGLGMPSSRYIDLTLLASGQSYTMPANGWLNIIKQSSTTGKYVALYNLSKGDMGVTSAAVTTNARCICLLPVEKDDEVICNYDANGETVRFRFYYAVGSESEA